MTAVLIVILGGGVLLAFREVRRASELVATDRLRGFTDGLASAAATPLPRLADQLRDAAREPAVRRVVRDPAPSRADLEAVSAILADLPGPGDSGMVSILRSADGRIAASFGELPANDARPATSAVVTGPDSLSIGEFYASGGRVYYWVTRPVTANGERIGTIAQRRRLNAQADAERNIRTLAGENVKVLFRNADGEFWTTLAGSQVPEPTDLREVRDMNTYSHPSVIGSERVILFEKAVERTPWVVIMELPASALSRGPRELLRRFAIMSVLLLAAGAAAMWLISRRITRPLARMTAAAEGIARGDYSQRVDTKGDYEIARLGVSFNRMATEIADADRQLKAAAGEAAAAQQQAELANAAKSNFLAAMSHELRTPLNAIAGYVELLELELRGPLTPEQRADLARVKRSQRYLLGLIEEILVFSQLDAQRLAFNIADVPVDPVIRDAEAMVEPRIREKGLVYTYEGCDPDLCVHADRDKMQQVIINLLVNATKYTDAGGSIRVSCSTQGDRVSLRVEDTGVGIPEEKLSHIFDPFVQLDRSLNNPREGVGLGLTISRDLARAMGGDLRVESEVGAGSAFTLELPASTASTGSDRILAKAASDA
jgi:signal transduction histidine kinase